MSERLSDEQLLENARLGVEARSSMSRELIERRAQDAVQAADAALVGDILSWIFDMDGATRTYQANKDNALLRDCRAAREGGKGAGERDATWAPRAYAEATTAALEAAERHFTSYANGPGRTAFDAIRELRWLRLEAPRSTTTCHSPLHAAAVALADAAELHDRIIVNSPDREWSESDLRTAINAYRALRAPAAEPAREEAERIVQALCGDGDGGGWSTVLLPTMPRTRATEIVRAALAAAKARP